jgi:hypothetical protein
LKIGPIHCPETLVKDYHSMLHATPEKQISSTSQQKPKIKLKDTKLIWQLYTIKPSHEFNYVTMEFVT